MKIPTIDQMSFSIYDVNTMKNTLPKRLERIFSDLGVNQTEFSQKTGFGQSYISQILNGSKTNPSSRFFDIVCREFSINPSWLKNGKGEIYVIPGAKAESEDSQLKQNSEIIAKYRLLPKTEQRIIDDIINALLSKKRL